jgi:hypothetical protein
MIQPLTDMNRCLVAEIKGFTSIHGTLELYPSGNRIQEAREYEEEIEWADSLVDRDPFRDNSGPFDIDVWKYNSYTRVKTRSSEIRRFIGVELVSVINKTLVTFIARTFIPPKERHSS